jgi:predicted nucleic acid-binding protein
VELVVGEPPRRKKPIPYLDTNVILDYIRNRNRDSVVLLDTIRRKKLRCYTSYFTILELLDRGQEDKWIWKRVQQRESLDDILARRYPRELTKDELKAVFKELNEKFLKPFVDTDIIHVMIPSDLVWDSILKFLQRWNFSIGDAFHVGIATNTNCNIFISNDSNLVKMINESKLIPATRPIELEKKLAKLGMRRVIP